MNANEIANGILSALVAITAGCPFVDYWGACLIGGVWVTLFFPSPSLNGNTRTRDQSGMFLAEGGRVLCGDVAILATVL